MLSPCRTGLPLRASVPLVNRFCATGPLPAVACSPCLAHGDHAQIGIGYRSGGGGIPATTTGPWPKGPKPPGVLKDAASRLSTRRVLSSGDGYGRLTSIATAIEITASRATWRLHPTAVHGRKIRVGVARSQPCTARSGGVFEDAGATPRGRLCGRAARLGVPTGCGRAYPAGSMFWFRWKTLSGSQEALICFRRS